MSGRRCGNCRHYEPSPVWRSGWCRNPRLYGPHESHLVRQDDLACAHRIGNYWEPTDDVDANEPGEGAGLVAGLVRPLRLFGPGPRFVAAASGSGSSGGAGPISGRYGQGGAGGSWGGGGSGSLSSSFSGSSSGSSSGAGSSGNRDAFGGGGGTGGAGWQPPAGEPGRPDRTGRLPGQERIVSYQPEERYWTDYLRIALPVVGLLLMLGLFWFWASQLIGGDDDNNPPASVVVDNPPTATPTQPPTEPTQDTGVVDSTEPAATEVSAADDSNGDDGDNNGNGTEETPEPPQPTATVEDEGSNPTEPANDGEIGEGDIVIVSSDDVNFRAEPNTEGEPIRQLANGEELTVTGPLEESGGNQWYPVVDKDGVEGYVAAQFVELAE
jgi:hypothetical protein